MTVFLNEVCLGASVTPVVSSGVPFPSSKYKLLSSPQRSDPLSKYVVLVRLLKKKQFVELL